MTDDAIGSTGGPIYRADPSSHGRVCGTGPGVDPRRKVVGATLLAVGSVCAVLALAKLQLAMSLSERATEVNDLARVQAPTAWKDPDHRAVDRKGPAIAAVASQTVRSTQTVPSGVAHVTPPTGVVTSRSTSQREMPRAEPAASARAKRSAPVREGEVQKPQISMSPTLDSADGSASSIHRVRPGIWVVVARSASAHPAAGSSVSVAAAGIDQRRSGRSTRPGYPLAHQSASDDGPDPIPPIVAPRRRFARAEASREIVLPTILRPTSF